MNTKDEMFFSFLPRRWSSADAKAVMVDADAFRTTGLDVERCDDSFRDCCAFGETMAVEPLGFRRGALLSALSWFTVLFNSER